MGGDPRLLCGGGNVGDETEKLFGNLRGLQPGWRGKGVKGSLGLTTLAREAAGVSSQVTFLPPVKVPYGQSGQASFSGRASSGGPVVNREGCPECPMRGLGHRDPSVSMGEASGQPVAATSQALKFLPALPTARHPLLSDLSPAALPSFMKCKSCSSCTSLLC